MFTETSLVLLGTTIAVSTLHLLFDILALQEDVHFWSSATSMRGLAVSALLWQLVCDVVVTAYLAHEQASLLITVPSAMAILVGTWKVTRAFSLRSTQSTSADHSAVDDPSTENVVDPTSSDSASSTARYDFVATSHIAAVLLPVVVGFATRSLVYDQHASWLSWALGTAVGVVHTLSFVGMIPQLYVNHQLRSVAHMPWRVLIYRFLNTIVDDLFAFVIRMPLLQRVSVFRDDIVFVALLAQRAYYPQRPHEQTRHSTA
jgi:hypothetical protein